LSHWSRRMLSGTDQAEAAQPSLVEEYAL
jgi:hypothetical protein